MATDGDVEMGEKLFNEEFREGGTQGFEGFGGRCGADRDEGDESAERVERRGGVGGFDQRGNVAVACCGMAVGD